MPTKRPKKKPRGPEPERLVIEPGEIRGVLDGLLRTPKKGEKPAAPPQPKPQKKG